MRYLPKLAAAFLAASALTLSAFAADITGTWKWTTQGRNGNSVETTAKLALKDGALTGTVSGRMGDAPIGDASFKDGKVAFTVTREFNGNKIVIKYDGKLEGDTITGKVERPGREGDSPLIQDWKATRAN
ncbi:MAG TPA: hypothetical protein VG734_01175 [Lacunisphaera sp.]|nr:hypothetical protein [Lacunisphaera sp.]